MSYWKEKPPAAENLLLFKGGEKWVSWKDCKETDKDIPGSQKEVEERLLKTLSSTNLIVLLGSGASFAAKNEQGNSAGEANDNLIDPPGMNDLWEAVKCNIGEDELNRVILTVSGNSKEENIETLLSLCKIKIELDKAYNSDGKGNHDKTDVLNPEGDGPDLREFVRKAEMAILDRVDFVSHSTNLETHKRFLRRLARRSVEKPRVKLFTTNYDRCIEEAAVICGLVLIDGFSHSGTQRFNRDNFQHDIVRRDLSETRIDYLDGVFHLYKLHGSMDWQRRRSDGVVIRSTLRNDQHDPALIYPRSSKYQEAFLPPYLDMFAAWQAALREPDTTLIICGFGFADDHISEPIWSALESNLSFRLVLCDPCFVPECKLKGNSNKNIIMHEYRGDNKFKNRILRLVTEGDNRVTILNGRFDDLSNSVPEFVGETDRQRLETLLEQIRRQNDVNL